MMATSLWDKVEELEVAVRRIVRSGQTIVVGGFGRGGVAFSIVEFLAAHPEEFRDLTLVKNDANEPSLGIGLMLRNPGQVSRLTSTHIGLNPEFIAQMNRGEIACEFVPQGIFAERLRAGGAGIPAFLTDIGVGTIVAQGKPTMELDGRTYLVERALRGDVAIVCADIADRAGNCWWRGSNRNMCIVAATAAQHVIVEAKQIVDTGAIEPENVQLPCVFVEAVVQARPRQHVARPKPPAQERKMSKVSRGELNLYVSDVERSVRFYGAALGFEVRDDPAMGSAGAKWRKVAAGDMTMVIFPSETDVAAMDAGRIPMMTADIVVDDLEAAVESLVAAGASVSTIRSYPGGRFTTFTDPDGIGWELIEPAKA